MNDLVNGIQGPLVQRASLVPIVMFGLGVASAACATAEDQIGTDGGGPTASGGVAATGGTGPGVTGGNASGGVTPVTCADGEVQCGAVCTVLGTNQHCSACNDACPAGSTCQATGGAPACVCDAADTTLCSTGCADLETDAANCGACDTPCEIGATCEAGLCVCPADTQVCGGFDGCVDILASNEHCGIDCAVCSELATCQAGVCACPEDGVIMLCGDVCTDTSSDPDNCGGCAGDTGVVCGPGELCKAGECNLELAITDPDIEYEMPTGGTFGILINIESWHNEHSKDTGTLQCQVASGSGSILVDVGGLTDELVFANNSTTGTLNDVPTYQAAGTLEIPDTLTGLSCKIYW